MKTITLGLLNLLLTISISAQQIGVIGSGSFDCTRTPAYALYDYSQSGTIYLASELEGIGISAGNSITAIEFEFNGWSNNYELNNQTIKISHVEEPSIPDNDYPDYRSLTLSNTTIVIPTLDLRLSSGRNWVQINFDTPFTWNGTDNILISWENRDGSWVSGYGYVEGVSTFLNRNHNWFSDNFYPTSSSGWDGYLPNIKIHTSFNPLPITLSEFTGELLNDDNHVSVKLNWTTASEKDNDYFTIWRSYDGQNWGEISNLVGAGNSNHELKYQFIDRNISPQQYSHKTIYYRLSQTDYDGTKEYFQIIPIELKSKRSHVVKRTNAIGQEVIRGYSGLVIETWNNGNTTKTIWR